MNAYLYTLATLTALSLGSFANVCIERLPARQSLWQRSRCLHCGRRLKWYDLAPLLSFILLKGQCRYCGRAISVQYPVIEFASVIIVMGVIYRYGWSWVSVIWVMVALVMLMIMVIDYRYLIIPNALVLCLFLLGVTNIVLNPEILVSRSLAAAVVITVPLLAGSVMYMMKGHFGMGMGDIKLLAVIGFLTGLAGALIVIMGAAMIGALFGLAGLACGKLDRTSKLPFGLFIGFVTLYYIFFKDTIIILINCITQ